MIFSLACKKFTVLVRILKVILNLRLNYQVIISLSLSLSLPPLEFYNDKRFPSNTMPAI
jgi:hypothetical protein